VEKKLEKRRAKSGYKHVHNKKAPRMGTEGKPVSGHEGPASLRERVKDVDKPRQSQGTPRRQGC